MGLAACSNKTRMSEQESHKYFGATIYVDLYQIVVSV